MFAVVRMTSTTEKPDGSDASLSDNLLKMIRLLLLLQSNGDIGLLLPLLGFAGLILFFLQTTIFAIKEPLSIGLVSVIK